LNKDGIHSTIRYVTLYTAPCTSYIGLSTLLWHHGMRIRLVVARTSSPPRAKEGQWLQVDVEDDRVLSAVIDEAETAKAKERIADKLARLRRGEHR
jgi:hypothetical protein